MGNNIKIKITLSLPVVAGMFLAIAPVLDPYVLIEIGSGFTIRINDVFAIILASLCFLKDYKYSNEYGFIIKWCIMFAIISLFGLMSSNELMLFITYKNIGIWTVYAIIIMYIWKIPCRDSFVKWIEMISIVCIIVILGQFIFGNLGIPFWDGRISLFTLSKYDGWSRFIDPNTFEIRPCGIFQEASYAGIYLLIAYAIALKNSKLVKALLYCIAMILTTSMFSILGCIIVTTYLLFISGSSIIINKTKRKFILFIIVVLIIVLLLGRDMNSLESTWQYISRRIMNLKSDLISTRKGSVQWRLLGNINLFEEYSLWSKLFGLGAQQYAAYFGVVNYSNNIVNIVLNYGLVGLCLFSHALYCLYRRIEKENKVFFIITMIVFFVDQQWFNWFFFYVLSACVVKKKIKERC